MESDRRSTDRDFPRGSQVTVRLAQGDFPMQMLDESPGGLGLYASEEGPFQSGDAVQILWESQMRPAILCYVRKHPHGGVQVGVEWTD